MAFKKGLVDIFRGCKTYPELINGMKLAKDAGFEQGDINTCVSHYKNELANESSNNYKIIPMELNKSKGNVSYSVLPVVIKNKDSNVILYNGQAFEV